MTFRMFQDMVCKRIIRHFLFFPCRADTGGNVRKAWEERRMLTVTKNVPVLRKERTYPEPGGTAPPPACQQLRAVTSGAKNLPEKCGNSTGTDCFAVRKFPPVYGMDKRPGIFRAACLGKGTRYNINCMIGSLRTALIAPG